jgi:hypothetical protein
LTSKVVIAGFTGHIRDDSTVTVMSCFLLSKVIGAGGVDYLVRGLGQRCEGVVLFVQVNWLVVAHEASSEDLILT